MQISKNEENQPSWNPCKKEMLILTLLTNQATPDAARIQAVV